MSARAQWEFVREGSTAIAIRDLDLGGVSVTNDADAVVDDLLVKYPDKRYLYQDSDGLWGALEHDGLSFQGFGNPTDDERAELCLVDGDRPNEAASPADIVRNEPTSANDSGKMYWYWSIAGDHTHARVFMNGAKCGDLCFRNEEFADILLTRFEKIVFKQDIQGG